MFNSTPFYHSTIRRLITVFGTLLNDIKIDRINGDGTLEERFLVPISYGPGKKWIARLNSETDNMKQTPAIILPRISFEIIDLQYDGTRKLSSNDNYRANKDVYEFLTANPPAPYNVNIQVSIIAKYAEDGTRIVEQILPYFKPEWTSHVKIIDDLDLVLDIPTVLTGVQTQEIYEGQFQERNSILWTLDFTMKAYFFGPVLPRKIIKFVDVNLYPSFNDLADSEEVHVYPGLTADGEPTTDPNKTIPWQQIEFEDPWDYIVEIVSIEDKRRNEYN